MVVHVVMFRFKEGERDEEAVGRARERIESLQGAIAGLESVETGVNFSKEERAMDLVLIARLSDRGSLEAYATHPAHLEVLEYLAPRVEYSKVVDYEVA